MPSKATMFAAVSALALVAGGLGCSPAQAQDSSAAPAAAGKDQLGEIIVTARRTAEDVQKIPLAVSVQTGETLKQHQVTDLYSVRNLTPSLQVQAQSTEVGAMQFAIRGIGTATNGPQVESSVGLVVDDVPIARAELGNVQFFDLNRIEVLRGPQGMLFGKNAAAGLINIVTEQPQLDKTEFLANVQYGNRGTSPSNGNSARMDVAGNMPLTDNAALRVDGFVSHDDAYAKNINIDQNLGMTEEGVRAKLRWEPTSRLHLLLSGDYVHENGPGESVFIHYFDAPGGYFAAQDAAAGITASPSNNKQASDSPNTNRFNIWGASLKADYDLGGGYTLTNVVGGRKSIMHSQADVDQTQLPVWVTDTNIHYSQVTEELRLTSPRDKRLTWQAGFFYLRYKGEIDYTFLGGNPLTSIYLGIPTLPPGTTELFGSTTFENARNNSTAGFVEGQYKITDKLALTAGTRFTHDQFNYSVTTLQQPGWIIPVVPLGTFANKATENNFSYRFSLNYNLNPNVLAYASYARGYKGPTFDSLSATLVKPEIPKVAELGLKSTLFDRHLRFNLALYHEVFEGFQAQALDIATTTVQTINAGQLKAKGVEAEFTLLPFEGFTLSGGVTYNNTKYKGLVVACYPGEAAGGSGTNVCYDGSVPGNAAGTTNVSGTQLADAPTWTESVTARYEHPVSANWTGFLQGDGYIRSHFNYSVSGDPRTRVGPTAIFGLSAGARQADGHLTATVFVKNLTDKRVPLYIQANPISGIVLDTAKGGDYYQLFGADSYRTIGVSLSYRM